MNKQLTLLPLLLSLSLAAFSSTQVNFLSGDLSQLKARSAREGKPLFVYFSAGWCMPCQWMDTHTFADEQLGVFLNERFLPVKINIDERAGLKEKERYRVKHLPSLLIIDTLGLVIARYEESLPADQLLHRLREYVAKPNTAALAAPAPVRPELKEAPRPAAHISRPALVPDRPLARPSVLGHTDYAALPSPVRQDSNPAGSGPAPPVKRNFGVQVGVFSNYDNTIRQVEQLEKRVRLPVNVFVSEHQSKKVYRIIIGVFKSQNEALQYAGQLRRQSIKAMIKDLTEL